MHRINHARKLQPHIETSELNLFLFVQDATFWYVSPLRPIAEMQSDQSSQTFLLCLLPLELLMVAGLFGFPIRDLSSSIGNSFIPFNTRAKEPSLHHDTAVAGNTGP